MENGEGKRGKYLKKEINLSARRQRIERGIFGGWKIFGQQRRKRTERGKVKNILETEKLLRT